MKIELGIKTLYSFYSYNPRTGVSTPLLENMVPNTILTSGRNQMSQQLWFSACQVGNNNTPPNAGQTGLQGYVAGTANVVNDEHGAQGAAPYYGWRRKTFRFAAGPIGNENLTEVGIGWATSGATLVARALIVDVNGDEITITPLADELLDVVVEVRLYPPTGDSIGTVDLNGVTYNYIFRASEVTSTTWWGQRIGTPIGEYSESGSDWRAFDGEIQTIDLAPSGTSADCDNSNQTDLAYSNNSYEQEMQCDCGTGGWNLAGGIRSIQISTTHGRYQTQFGEDPGALGNKVPKDATFTMEMVWVVGWVEEVLP